MVQEKLESSTNEWLSVIDACSTSVTVWFDGYCVRDRMWSRVVTLITGPVLLELHGESPAGRFSSHCVGGAVSFLLFVPEEEEEQLHEGESDEEEEEEEESEEEEEEEEELEEEEEGEVSEEEAMVAEKAEGEGEEERAVEALRFCQERVPPGMRSNSSSSVGLATPATPAARVCARFAFPCERAHCRMARLVRFSDFRCATPCRRALCLCHSCSRPSNCASVSSHSARAISAFAARFARSASSSASPSSRAFRMGTPLEACTPALLYTIEAAALWAVKPTASSATSAS
ncbi:unnamed protein product [Closterium sp. Naga37s-1]|nr:unnamed protein product [Closterium sp. Naga37s-1]